MTQGIEGMRHDPDLVAEQLAHLFRTRFKEEIRKSERVLRSELMPVLINSSEKPDLMLKYIPEILPEEDPEFVPFCSMLVSVIRRNLVVELLKAGFSSSDPQRAVKTLGLRARSENNKLSFITVSSPESRAQDYVRRKVGWDLINEFGMRIYQSNHRDAWKPFLDALVNLSSRTFAMVAEDFNLNVGISSSPEQTLLEDASLNSNHGAVEFIEVDERLAATPNKPNESSETYRSLLESTIGNLVKPDIIQLIDNSAPELPELIKDYQQELLARDIISPEALWLKGYRIQRILDVASTHDQDPEFPPLPRSVGNILSEFAVTHNLFMWCFPRIRFLIADLEASQAGLQPLFDQKTNSYHDVLLGLSRQSLIFNQQSLKMFDIAAGVSQQNVGTPEPKALSAVKIGLLRGSLQRMTRILIAASTVAASYVLGGVVGNAATDALRGSVLYDAIISFFSIFRNELTSLAHAAPGYFGWLKHVFQTAFWRR